MKTGTRKQPDMSHPQNPDNRTKQKKEKEMKELLTMEEINKMYEKRLERAKELLQHAKTKEEKRMLEKRIWMLQNS